MQIGDSGLLPLTSMLEKLVRDRRICRDELTLKQSQNRGWKGNDSKACPWASEQEADDRHPLRGFVSDVVRATGLNRQNLIDAADRGFTDAVDIVDALKRCDADGTTARLAAKLHRETPEVTERVFRWLKDHRFETTLNQPSQLHGKAPGRRGRQKADYETLQREAALAADWEYARAAGTYKVDFARDHCMKVRELDAMLARVRGRKRRAN